MLKKQLIAAILLFLSTVGTAHLSLAQVETQLDELLGESEAEAVSVSGDVPLLVALKNHVKLPFV